MSGEDEMVEFLESIGIGQVEGGLLCLLLVFVAGAVLYMFRSRNGGPPRWGG